MQDIITILLKRKGSYHTWLDNTTQGEKKKKKKSVISISLICNGEVR